MCYILVCWAVCQFNVGNYLIWGTLCIQLLFLAMPFLPLSRQTALYNPTWVSAPFAFFTRRPFSVGQLVLELKAIQLPAADLLLLTVFFAKHRLDIDFAMMFFAGTCTENNSLLKLLLPNTQFFPQWQLWIHTIHFFHVPLQNIYVHNNGVFNTPEHGWHGAKQNRSLY